MAMTPRPGYELRLNQKFWLKINNLDYIKDHLTGNFARRAAHSQNLKNFQQKIFRRLSCKVLVTIFLNVHFTGAVCGRAVG